MRYFDVVRAWKSILCGRAPSLSIEITRECPLRCPGCYAYEDNHLGGTETLRTLSDFKGDALVQNVLKVVDRAKPLHLSIVGGDPLVRYRELEASCPAVTQPRYSRPGRNKRISTNPGGLGNHGPHQCGGLNRWAGAGA